MQLIEIQFNSPIPIYQQIIDWIRDQVREGTLGPLEALPSVRQLAGELEINPNTVAKAYLLLEREGIVRTVRRRGCFVAEGAVEELRRSTDTRLASAIDQVLEETARLGLDRHELLAALRLRLDTGETPGAEEGGTDA